MELLHICLPQGARGPSRSGLSSGVVRLIDSKLGGYAISFVRATRTRVRYSQRCLVGGGNVQLAEDRHESKVGLLMRPGAGEDDVRPRYRGLRFRPRGTGPLGANNPSPHSTIAEGGGLCKCLKRLAPQVGLEPTTLRLTVVGFLFLAEEAHVVPSQCV